MPVHYAPSWSLRTDLEILLLAAQTRSILRDQRGIGRSAHAMRPLHAERISYVEGHRAGSAGVTHNLLKSSRCGGATCHAGGAIVLVNRQRNSVGVEVGGGFLVGRSIQRDRTQATGHWHRCTSGRFFAGGGRIIV